MNMETEKDHIYQNQWPNQSFIKNFINLRSLKNLKRQTKESYFHKKGYIRIHCRTTKYQN